MAIFDGPTMSDWETQTIKCTSCGYIWTGIKMKDQEYVRRCQKCGEKGEDVE